MSDLKQTDYDVVLPQKEISLGYSVKTQPFFGRIADHFGNAFGKEFLPGIIVKGVAEAILKIRKLPYGFIFLFNIFKIGFLQIQHIPFLQVKECVSTLLLYS
jgi:hypothetical protein